MSTSDLLPRAMQYNNHEHMLYLSRLSDQQIDAYCYLSSADQFDSRNAAKGRQAHRRREEGKEAGKQGQSKSREGSCEEGEERCLP